MEGAISTMVKIFLKSSKGKERLDKKEFQKLVQCQCCNILSGADSKEAVGNMTDGLDNNQDGKVGFEEYMKFVGYLAVSLSEQRNLADQEPEQNAESCQAAQSTPNNEQKPEATVNADANAGEKAVLKLGGGLTNPGTAMTSAAKMAEGAKTAVEETAGAAVAAAEETAGKAAKAVNETAEKAAKTAEETANKAVETAGETAGKLANAAEETANKAVEAVGETAGKAAAAMGETAKAAVAAVGETAGKAEAAMGEMATKAKETVDGAVKAVGDAADKVPAAVEEEAEAAEKKMDEATS
ncbi:S100 calcium binding protein U [Pholidichthys leucotaenia]